MSIPNQNPQDFRPALSKVVSQGSAHEGVHHWIGQRVSAIALLPLGLFLLGWLEVFGGESHMTIIESISNPWIAGLIFLSITAASYHGALGIQVVIDDYVHATGWRHWFLIKTKFLMILLPVLSLVFLMKIIVLGIQ